MPVTRSLGSVGRWSAAFRSSRIVSIKCGGSCVVLTPRSSLSRPCGGPASPWPRGSTASNTARGRCPSIMQIDGYAHMHGLAVDEICVALHLLDLGGDISGNGLSKLF